MTECVGTRQVPQQFRFTGEMSSACLGKDCPIIEIQKADYRHRLGRARVLDINGKVKLSEEGTPGTSESYKVECYLGSQNGRPCGIYRIQPSSS